MLPDKKFESMLSGGHPNSLGNTIEVVDRVLADKSKLGDLYSCYFSQDEVVRLRVSSALKRVCKEHPDWLIPYIDALQDEISKIEQASTQWTLAILFDLLKPSMSAEQISKAVPIMQKNLETNGDWIVQNTTLQILYEWSIDDRKLSNWLQPQLKRMVNSKHKSVSHRATKLLAKQS